MNPITLLSVLYAATEEDSLAAWEAFEETPLSRDPAKRMDATAVALILSTSTAFEPSQVAAVLAKLTDRVMTIRQLVDDMNERANTPAGPGLGVQLLGLARFYGLPLESIFTRPAP